MTSLPCHVRVQGSGFSGSGFGFGVRACVGRATSDQLPADGQNAEAVARHATASDRAFYSRGVGAAGAESARWRRSRAYAAVTSTP